MPTLPIPSARSALVGCTIALLGAACASPQDREAAAGHVVTAEAVGALHDARVVVACQASDEAIRDVCAEQLRAEVAVRGSRVVPSLASAPGASVVFGEQQWLADARAAGARVVLVMAPTPVAVEEGGSAFSIGIGSFGFGRGGGLGGGLGVSAPLGAPRVATGFVATGRLINVATGRTIWTARSSVPPSPDAGAQFGGLALSLLDVADRDGLF